ncbi:MAG: PIN domain protein [Candidatus Scalindua rubra]|uniref:PIN domain protein n=1 Tax=Candidatus Scalindua rubra TaxID=1872076 RepID=A0A1E3X6M3_9BACT|nr:MAG: PIN domain protein [Candidatus Scalindua rubra]
MIFDTDIFIWVQKGNEKAAKFVDQTEERFLSIQTYMELLQCARNKVQHKNVKEFLSSYGFIVLPFTENIGHRASIYIEEYTLSTGLRTGDAIIAATATENNMALVSSNAKHFKPIRELKLKSFKP